MAARRYRRLRWAAIAATAAVVGACGAPGGRTEYAEDGDTGAASAAIDYDSSSVKMLGADSATGASAGRTGRPAMAGDTLGARGSPVGVPDSVASPRPPRPPQPR